MRGAGRTARLRLPLIPLVLALLALLDLRTEFQLLLDHFTITSLVEIPRHHPLAIAVLLCTPWLWKQSR
ncbi:MAG: hypothetical protein FJ076_02265 [Cyanobacteria bacterium K_DeepCast_35m_m1_288]|jgi:hypothetical protein|nr:hypothetical protein [Cyanobacteria bacterium K_DeepCast_35m_m1_288]